MEKTQPNILMFIPHDLGEHLNCYGHSKVKSPNLDRLAETGVRFSNFFTTAPECTPSRAGLYTGQYTHQNGLMGLCHRGWSFNSEAKHLAVYLLDSGYNTNLFGFNHETILSPSTLGYRNICSQNVKDSRIICSDVSKWLTDVADKMDTPWFASIGFMDTHREWRKSVDFKNEDVEVPPYLPDTPAVRADLAEMYQAIYDMDQGIGQVLDALEKTGQDKNTIVIYTSDHGIPFPRAKSTFYDPGIRVAMIMKGNSFFKGGRICDQLVSNLDYTPTILELCGVDVDKEFEGKSYAGLLKNENYNERDAVYGALYYDAFYDPMHYVRTKNFKYIRSFAVTEKDAAGVDPEVLAKHESGNWIRCDDSDVQRSPSWEEIKKQGPFEIPPPEELYDLKNDPEEKNNLADNPEYRNILDNLRSKLNEMMERTNSPLLKGHVPPELSISRNQRL